MLIFFLSELLFPIHICTKHLQKIRLTIIDQSLSCLEEFGSFEEYPLKNIFYFTTVGDWGCVAAVERLPAICYSVDFILLSFGITGFIVEL